jgi:hypothetical protein
MESTEGEATEEGFYDLVLRVPTGGTVAQERMRMASALLRAGAAMALEAGRAWWRERWESSSLP